MTAETLLKVDNLKVSFKTYAGEVQSVRGINFEVKKGECLGIVGESGCGKSVTSQAIMQLLKTPPAMYKEGNIVFEGEDLLKKSEKEMQKVRGNSISMIFQDPMTSLNPTQKIGKQIAEVLREHKNISKAEAYAEAEKMLELVSMPEPKKRMNQYPHEFSGGMRQRAMIAMALACRPKLIIADEPTTALDVTVQAQILELLQKVQKEIGMSIIMITHDLGVVAKMCDRVAVMYAGQIVEQGSVEAIFNRPSHPYTKGLLSAVPSMEMDRSKALTTIPGTPPDLFAPPAGCGFYARCNKAMKVCQNHMPQMQMIDGELTSACWLNHPMCPAQNRND
ncbi:ABC transporter ATP-binding protein [Cellulosilyticum ruminicola]|uniref:ABC transporter ATP-binding protein n=1 Tax=Cellulosilyticum ruminicola TaxID=425254 RepID=UPI0006CF2238|nr:ABC transporter ATP-binding protein [Cellulosilyticum ruminicola]